MSEQLSGKMGERDHLVSEWAEGWADDRVGE